MVPPYKEADHSDRDAAHTTNLCPLDPHFASGAYEGGAYRCLIKRGLEARESLRAEAERLMMDRHDEMSAGFIGHLHGLFQSAVRMNPGIVSADRHDSQIDGTGSAQLRKRIAQRGVATDATVISFKNVAVVTAIGGASRPCAPITRAVRDLASRFEHRLFLSATPHNGHSNSFSTLLELLDPYRFTRGVKVRGKRALDDVMIRRLKEDIRNVQGGLAKRNVDRIVIDRLPEDPPELALSRLLDEYPTAREERFASNTCRAQARQASS
jgi:hypothetical protein